MLWTMEGQKTGRRIRATGLMAVLALASGCFIHKSIPAVQDRPVPAEASLRWLDGEWEGTYQSQLAGSRGTIRFKLTAKADSAYGTGILLARPPRQPRTTAMPMFHPPPGQQFSIVFIPCHSGLITGTLDLYEDPETGERI